MTNKLTFFWLAIVTANELGFAFPPRNLPKKFRPDPSTFYLLIVVTNRQTQTNAGDYIIPRGDNENLNAAQHLRHTASAIHLDLQYLTQAYGTYPNRPNMLYRRVIRINTDTIMSYGLGSVKKTTKLKAKTGGHKTKAMRPKTKTEKFGFGLKIKTRTKHRNMHFIHASPSVHWFCSSYKS